MLTKRLINLLSTKKIEMSVSFYEISKDIFTEVAGEYFMENRDKTSSLFLVNIKNPSRENATKELEHLGINANLKNKLLKPQENLRFKYINDFLYGEISFFSSKTKETDFAAILIKNNVMFLIHSFEENILSGTLDTFTSFTKKQKNRFNDMRAFLYYIIHEILSYHGTLILKYGEEVERLADKFEDENKEVSPEDFLVYRKQLSKLERVVERQIYTLSLPPSESVLDLDTPYKPYFIDLLKGLSLFKASLERTEDRLDDMNDHLQMKMQEKMNKRLNFLTIVQSIFAPLTLIAGIYGMNFVNMPELHFKYGYFFTLGVMVITSIFFIKYFYKHKWFD